ERRAGGRWPTSLFDVPVLRGLDERARNDIQAAGTIITLAPGDVAYRANDIGESFFVVASGAVTLRATRRGDASESEIRVVGAGDTFGEEAVVGARRAGTAAAHVRSVVAEVPVHVFLRGVKRAGSADVADRLERTLRRCAARDVLRKSALGRDLP